MRKPVIRRALAALGTFAVVAIGLVSGSSPAGATVPGWQWHYPEANCAASSIRLAVGGMAWGGQAPIGSSTEFNIRGFCPKAGYTPAQKVWDTEENRYRLEMPGYIKPSEYEYIPGLDEHTDWWDEYLAYKDDLQAVYDRVYQDLGSPPRIPNTMQEPDNMGRWWAATEAAVNAQLAVDQINYSFSQLIPTEAVANITATCSPWFGCWNHRFNGLARLRSMAPSTPMSNWYWMNNWLWGNGINGNIGSSWSLRGWSGATNGTGGLAGCTHVDTGVATGNATAAATHQLWHATTSFGCAIGGGDTQNGGGVLLTGIQADYKADWWGGQHDTP